MAVRKQYYLEKLTTCPDECDYVGQEESEYNEIDTECNLEFDLPPVRRIPAIRATSASSSSTNQETENLGPLTKFPGKGRRLGHK